MLPGDYVRRHILVLHVSREEIRRYTKSQAGRHDRSHHERLPRGPDWLQTRAAPPFAAGNEMAKRSYASDMFMNCDIGDGIGGKCRNLMQM